MEEFYDEVQRKLRPGFKGFGRNLLAFNDVLRRSNKTDLSIEN